MTTLTAPPAVRRRLVTAVLSLIAGLSDCLGWVLLKGAFTAHITGNVVVAAAHSGRGQTPSLAAVLAIPVFIVVTALATALSLREPRPLVLQRRLLGGQTALLLAAAVAGSALHASLATLLLAVGAMALQNALLHLLISPAPATAVMTGNLVTAAVAVTRLAAGRDDRRASAAALAHTWPLLVGFVAGCAVAAAATTVLADGAWFLPAAVSLAITAWLWNRGTVTTE